MVKALAQLETKFSIIYNVMTLMSMVQLLFLCHHFLANVQIPSPRTLNPHLHSPNQGFVGSSPYAGN